MNMWKCETCNRNHAQAITRCRSCGRQRPVYGIIDKPTAQDHARKVKKPTKANEKNASAKSNDPHIGSDDSPAVSTLKMKD